MNPAMKVAAGVAGGYLLGRHKKLRYAVGFGAALLGKRLDLNPSRLVLTGVKGLRELPEVMELSDTVRGQLAASGRRAATTLMSNRLDTLSDSLRERSAALESGDTGGDQQRDQQEQSHDEVYPEERQQTAKGGQRQRKAATAGRGGGESQRRAEDEGQRARQALRDGPDDQAGDDDRGYEDDPDDVDARDHDRGYDDEPDDVDARNDDRGYDDEPDRDEPADADRGAGRDDEAYDDTDDEPVEPRRSSRRRAGANA